ncbi:MAG: sugar ABC transporter permease, partial [Candidatus Devosia euplotis]|nr:sugar ABC transporter permease [Candidatus Devosia euplotis]
SAADAAARPSQVSSPVGGGRRQPVAVRWRRLGDVPAAWLLILPVLILFAITVIYPLVETIRLSFFDIKGIGKPIFIGIGNYTKLFTDAAFRSTLWTTRVFTLGTTTITVSLGWLLAVFCSFAPQRTLPFRVMIFAAFGIFSPGFARPWLCDPDTALWMIIVAASWSGVGLPLMLYFAAVQSIQRSVLEAAYMDGVKPLSIMRFIMAPLSMPGVRVAVFINLLGASAPSTSSMC